jgi:orotidine-5'-phosphate decarboxylase
MLLAAVAAAREESESCGVLAVTILTSLDTQSLAKIWGRPVPRMDEEVLRLAAVAAEVGAHGVVCSGQEAAAVRATFGDRLAPLVPGIRLPGGNAEDQSRVVTPRQAAEAGARYIVIGRAVTAAGSSRDAMSAVLSDLP